MKLSTFLVFLFICQAPASKPINRGNGIWYPGKGCGITTEIKYLSEIPVDDSDLKCTFIQTESPKKLDLDHLKMNPDCFMKGDPLENKEKFNTLKIPIEEAQTMEACMKFCLNNAKCQFIDYAPWGCYLQEQDLKTVTKINYNTETKHATKSCIIESFYKQP